MSFYEYCTSSTHRIKDNIARLQRYHIDYNTLNKKSFQCSNFLITRIHSSRMRTSRSLPYGGSLSGGSVSRGMGLCPCGCLCSGRPPRRNMGPEQKPPRRNMGPGSQTGSDIIQRPPCEQND